MVDIDFFCNDNKVLFPRKVIIYGFKNYSTPYVADEIEFNYPKSNENCENTRDKKTELHFATLYGNEITHNQDKKMSRELAKYRYIIVNNIHQKKFLDGYLPEELFMKPVTVCLSDFTNGCCGSFDCH